MQSSTNGSGHRCGDHDHHDHHDHDHAEHDSEAAPPRAAGRPGGHGHSHGHHGHGHGHGHAHGATDFGRAFAIGVALNLGFVGVEAAYGFAANSMALIADAGHNLSDVFGLVMAWAAAAAAKRAPSARFTYGLRSASILAALANALLLLAAVGVIGWEAIQRFARPEPVTGTTVITVAAIGIVINAATALLFFRGRGADINVRGAYLHMAADAAVSLGVVLAGLAMLWTGALWIDPAVSLVIAAVIVWGTWWLLRDSVDMALAAVPPGIDAAAVRGYLQRLPGVTGVHDLHIWPISTTETALTCHLVMPGGHPGDRFLAETADAMRHRFGICHATLQIEMGDHLPCALEPDSVL